MAPAAGAAGRAEELLEPLIAQHQHRICLDHQPGLLIGHAPGLKLLSGEQVQEVLLAVALNSLLRMGRAEELAPLGPAGTGLGVAIRALGHPKGYFAGASLTSPLQNQTGLCRLQSLQLGLVTAAPSAPGLRCGSHTQPAELG